MKRAILMRHASAAEAAHDALRALSAEGYAEAARAGHAIAALGAPWTPARALCSTALRASATLEAARVALPSLAQVELAAALYLGSAGELLASIQRAPDADSCVLLVAHEPGISALVRLLAGRAAPDARALFARGMTPASFAALALDVARWADTAPGCAELVAFART